MADEEDQNDSYDEKVRIAGHLPFRVSVTYQMNRFVILAGQVCQQNCYPFGFQEDHQEVAQAGEEGISGQVR